MASKIFLTEREGSALVIMPIGELMGVSEHRLNLELDRISGEIREQGAAHLVIDFEQAPYFGSLMLSAMLRLSRQLPAGQGKLALCNVSPLARDVLQVTRLDARWPVFASRQEAFASFGPA
jgi:anti-anti-sigma factor